MASPSSYLTPIEISMGTRPPAHIILTKWHMKYPRLFIHGSISLRTESIRSSQAKAWTEME